ncbi:MAG: carboxymuconolactone decarboxylase family protein [Rhodobacteraceae bacterium]|nr:carboxymuconolactone decarboxylase family protein [Paracoccaceae bacterium]
MFIPPKPISDYPWYIRLFFWKQKQTYGKVLEPGMLWARSPGVFVGVALLYGALNRRRGRIDPALRSLVTVRVSQINHCEFCIDINASTLLKRGASEEKVMHLSDWRNHPGFDEKETLALELTEAITFSDRQVGAPLMDRLKEHFDDDALAELCGLIAFQNMSSKYNAALDIPAQGFCRLPLSPARDNST